MCLIDQVDSNDLIRMYDLLCAKLARFNVIGRNTLLVIILQKLIPYILNGDSIDKVLTYYVYDMSMSIINHPHLSTLTSIALASVSELICDCLTMI